jgi:hypothetical protein
MLHSLKEFVEKVAPLCGPFCFGAVIGWVLRFVLAFAKEISVGSLAIVIGAIGGGAINALFENKDVMFGLYSIGLACGFLLHVLLLDVDKGSGEIKYKWRA